MKVHRGVVLYKLNNTGLKRIYGSICLPDAGGSFFSSNDLSLRCKVPPVEGIVSRGYMWLFEENDELAVELYDQELVNLIKKQEEVISKLNKKRLLIKKEVRS